MPVSLNISDPLQLIQELKMGNYQVQLTWSNGTLPGPEEMALPSQQLFPWSFG